MAHNNNHNPLEIILYKNVYAHGTQKRRFDIDIDMNIDIGYHEIENNYNEINQVVSYHADRRDMTIGKIFRKDKPFLGCPEHI